MEPMLATVPKSTMGATDPSTKLVPWIVTLPDGISEPEEGETDVTVGAVVGAKVNSLTAGVPVALDVPPPVVTVTTTWSVPAPAGSAARPR